MDRVYILRDIEVLYQSQSIIHIHCLYATTYYLQHITPSSPPDPFYAMFHEAHLKRVGFLVIVNECEIQYAALLSFSSHSYCFSQGCLGASNFFLVFLGSPILNYHTFPDFPFFFLTPVTFPLFFLKLDFVFCPLTG